jgi:hypothetical protein
MRRTVVLACDAAVTLVFVVTGNAITFGENDSGRHPFVGSLVGDFHGNTFQLCTGTLMSPTVFLTAGHCFAETIPLGVTNFGVTFDEVIDADGDGTVDAGVAIHHGVPHVHPDWGFPSLGGSNADPYDVAVLVLDRPGSRCRPLPGYYRRRDRRPSGPGHRQEYHH